VTTASRRKGADAERAVVAYLTEHGFPYAERRLCGAAGPDITGTPGIAWEVKSARRHELAAWVDQAEAQRPGVGANLAPLVIKRTGTTDVGRWYAVLPMAQLVELLKAAGW
jgi:hypothetical protein